jgi:hypothetical protein
MPDGYGALAGEAHCDDLRAKFAVQHDFTCKGGGCVLLGYIPATQREGTPMSTAGPSQGANSADGRSAKALQ